MSLIITTLIATAVLLLVIATYSYGISRMLSR